jgi:hypothetical protein
VHGAVVVLFVRIRSLVLLRRDRCPPVNVFSLAAVCTCGEISRSAARRQSGEKAGRIGSDRTSNETGSATGEKVRNADQILPGSCFVPYAGRYICEPEPEVVQPHHSAPDPRLPFFISSASPDRLRCGHGANPDSVID